MINKIEEKVKYEVTDNYFNFKHTFENNDDAETAEKYLIALKNFLNFLDVKESDCKHAIITVFPNNDLYFEGINWYYYIEPDWEGHHPNGGTQSGTYTRISYSERFRKELLLAKIYKTNINPYDSSKWNHIMEVYDDFKIIYPNDKACDIIKNMNFLAVTGVKLMNF